MQYISSEDTHRAEVSTLPRFYADFHVIPHAKLSVADRSGSVVWQCCVAVEFNGERRVTESAGCERNFLRAQETKRVLVLQYRIT